MPRTQWGRPRVRPPRASRPSRKPSPSSVRCGASEPRGLRFDGSHYQLAGVHPGPAPAHPIQVWIGANQPRALALTGRVADGWVTPLMNYKPPRAAADGNRSVDRAARAAGRDPREIRRIFNITGAIVSTAPGPASDDNEAIVGPPAHWAEVLTHFALDLGFATFVLVAPPDPRTLSAFIEDVAPRVRDRVAERRRVLALVHPAGLDRSDSMTSVLAFAQAPDAATRSTADAGAS